MEEQLNSYIIVKRLSCASVRIVSHFSELMIQPVKQTGGVYVFVVGSSFLTSADGCECHHFVPFLCHIAAGDEGKASDDISLTLVENCSHYHGKCTTFPYKPAQNSSNLKWHEYVPAEMF